MGIKSLSSSKASLHSDPSANLTDSVNFNCYLFSPGSYIATTCYITNIVLLLPLCILIFYYGVQEWLKKRSTSAAPAISHSDCFTYHMASIELVGIVGSVLSCFALYETDLTMFSAAVYFVNFNWYGQMLFHILTCVERYLAVVHPVTYRSLRNDRGVRIRNISIGCIWLLCFAGMGLMTFTTLILFLDLCLQSFALIIISFCSLSVLCGLIRSGPGEREGGRERVDQMKLRAFYTIMAILGVLSLRFTWSLMGTALYILGRKEDCGIMASSVWSALPSSLVLPLLFLQRTGKCSCSKKTIH